MAGSRAWTDLPANPVFLPTLDSAMGMYDPQVVSYAGKYHMFYTLKIGENAENIGYASSTDGIAWTKVEGSALKGALMLGGTASVLKKGNGFQMWRMGEGGVFYATSGIATKIRISNRAHPLAVRDPSSRRSFDTRGKRMRTHLPGITPTAIVVHGGS